MQGTGGGRRTPPAQSSKQPPPQPETRTHPVGAVRERPVHREGSEAPFAKRKTPHENHHTPLVIPAKPGPHSDTGAGTQGWGEWPGFPRQKVQNPMGKCPNDTKRQGFPRSRGKRPKDKGGHRQAQVCNPPAPFASAQGGANKRSDVSGGCRGRGARRTLHKNHHCSKPLPTPTRNKNAPRRGRS